MRRDTLTGSRIRERRTLAGMKQADLARRADISASYLNLIEHNRRRIGGKLLNDIAAALGVEPSLLSEGAEAALLVSLREAAAGMDTEVELDRIEEFAGRFPGWAKLLAETCDRVGALERTVQTLSDRVTHDPQLAASLHEMLSVVTAIRSTASILAEPGEIEPDWQARFHRNIHEDSARLSEASRALASYLDNIGDADTTSSAPQEEVDALLGAHEFHFPTLEAGDDTPAALAKRLGGGLSGAAQQILSAILTRYATDASVLPLAGVEDAVAELGMDPVAIAARFACAPERVLRRLAALPQSDTRPATGLAICDAAGAMLFRKPLEAFPLPRLGAACTMLPLFSALVRPGTMICELLEQPGRDAPEFMAYACAAPAGAIAINRPPLLQAHMLILPVSGQRPALPVARVGVSCRICPRPSCRGRREPSIMS